jgi:hypothetical protein
MGSGFVFLWLSHGLDLTKPPHVTQTPISHQNNITASLSP